MKFAIALLFAFVALAGPGSAEIRAVSLCSETAGADNLVLEHGGGLNKCGCHFNRKTGDCHCHQNRECGCECQPSSCG